MRLQGIVIPPGIFPLPVTVRLHIGNIQSFAAAETFMNNPGQQADFMQSFQTALHDIGGQTGNLAVPFIQGLYLLILHALQQQIALGNSPVIPQQCLAVYRTDLR